MQLVAAEKGHTMNLYERPSFIPASIVDAPIAFTWEGAQAHIGPVEMVTPLMKSLGQGTGLAQVAQCAGVLLWATWRLKKAANVDHNLELAEAAFAYGVDWRYIDRKAGPWQRGPMTPPWQPVLRVKYSASAIPSTPSRRFGAFAVETRQLKHS